MKANSITTKQLPLLFSQWRVNRGEGLKTSSPSMILDKWNTMINGKLNPLNTIDDLSDAEAVQLVINESEEDQQTIRSMLIEDLIEKHNVMDKQQYVKVNQTLLIRILDKLFLYSQTRPLNENILLLYNTISQHMQSTLDFVEDFFNNYFDHNEKVPELYISIAKENIKKQVKQLKHTVSKQESTDPFLTNIVLDSIQHLLGAESIVITYRRLSYHKMLLNELLSQKVVQSTQSIKEALYYINYNQDNFVSYEYECLKELTNELSTHQEKIVALRFEQKKINQLPLKSNCCYNPNMPSLKDQINGWIDEEVKFFENIQLPEKVANKLNENEDKIHTSLSVAKLAVLLRLLVIDKIIINRTVAPMLRVAAKIFTTLQADTISFGSLETKYHAPDKATINAVKDMLFKWINILNRL
ncbi:MAG TPA: hypothetical protein VMU83_03425 [Hanamia sp.]|nr:hypothetical protein [Hanamia sp.]